jgi:hypothetical protein
MDCRVALAVTGDFVQGSGAVSGRIQKTFHEQSPIRHRKRSAAIHRGKSAVMDCRAALAVTRILFKARVRYRVGCRKLALMNGRAEAALAPALFQAI